jgi:neutral ceramidase
VKARLLAPAALLLAGALAAATPAQASTLRAGVGKADIEPPTGYFMMGWVRGDAKTVGQHTRLFARALVLERDGRKVALVAEDLNGIPGGMLKDAATMVKDRGFSEQNVLDSASHTHAAPGGYYNFGTYNTIFPSMATLTDPGRIFDFNLTNTAPDPQLYTFMVKQLAAAIRRADDNLGPAKAGWGEVDLPDITRNRSIEAHLADHGILVEPGQGNAGMDPEGRTHTIDPEVNVLRVDKVQSRRVCAKPHAAKRIKQRARRCRRRKVSVPIGAWSTFADHGTVNQYTFNVYNRDHHGSAIQVFEQKVRKAGKVPAGQEVLNVYGNTDEGDVSAGLDHNGPAWADHVGRTEAASMLQAWRQAGRSMSSTPKVELRWTRICFCGQEVENGKSVDSTAVFGLPEFTGSEEGRGPLYDETHESFEGRRSPVASGSQEHKIQVVRDNTGGTPQAAPLLAVRVGNRLIVSIPGEMTEGMGRRVRADVLKAVPGSGIVRVVISGLANEYVSYFTTPEEYDRQHYEGGATLYGEQSSNLLKASLVELAKKLAGGQPAQAPYPYDPKNGFGPDGPPFDPGAASGTPVEQPKGTSRLQRAVFSWRGGPRGNDRPVDRAFVSVERRSGKKWKRIDSDLGIAIVWTVDADGVYKAQWEAPLGAPRGLYRFSITANRYKLTSGTFHLSYSPTLRLREVPARPGRVSVALDYPDVSSRSAIDAPLLWLPQHVHGGRVRFRVGSRNVTVRRKTSSIFTVRAPAGTPVSIAPKQARDRHGNAAGAGLKLR